MGDDLPTQPYKSDVPPTEPLYVTDDKAGAPAAQTNLSHSWPTILVAAATDHAKAGELLGFGPLSGLNYLTCLLDHPDYTQQIYGMAGLRDLPRSDRLAA